MAWRDALNSIPANLLSGQEKGELIALILVKHAYTPESLDAAITGLDVEALSGFFRTLLPARTSAVPQQPTNVPTVPQQPTNVPIEDINILTNFAMYAVGNLSFEDSEILRVPSPFRMFKKNGEVFPLFLRKAYCQLRKCIDDYKDRIDLFSVQGTAGIGKSVFGMLWVLLQAQKGGQVLWHIANQFYLLDFSNREKPKVEWLQKDIAARWMWKKDVWLVADGAYSYQFVGQCYVLQVCSFKEDNYREFAKTPELQILYHPVWTEDEMLCYVDKCKELNIKTINKESIRKLFPVLGGVPRYILQPKVLAAKDNESKEAGPEAMEVEGDTDDSVDEELAQTDNESIVAGPEAMQVEADIDKKAYKAGIKLVDGAINNYSGNISQLFQRMGGTYVEKVSDKLVHCTTGDCLSRTMVFASDYVKKQMFTFMMRQDKILFRKWLEDYQDDTAVGPLWGSLFETFAHQVLCKGGFFKMQNLHNGSEEDLRMNSSMKKLKFSNATDLVGLDKERAYAKAREGFTSIDGLFLEPGEPPVFFQVFKRQKGEAHGFVFHMLQNIDETMGRPAYKLVCVVPRRLADKTKLQPYYRTDKKVYQFRANKDKLCKDKFTQYVLPLDFSFIEKESVWTDL